MQPSEAANLTTELDGVHGCARHCPLLIKSRQILVGEGVGGGGGVTRTYTNNTFSRETRSDGQAHPMHTKVTF